MIGKQSTLNDLLEIKAQHDALAQQIQTLVNQVDNIDLTPAEAAEFTALVGDVSAITGNEARGLRTERAAYFFSPQSGASFIHIKTNMKTDTDNVMYHFKVTGYSYGESKDVENTFAGFCNGPAGGLVSVGGGGTHDANGVPHTYIASDGCVTLRLYFANTYFLNLILDSIYLDGGRVFRDGDFTIVRSEQEAI